VLDEANKTVAVYREAAVNFNRHMESMKHSFVALSRQTMPTVKKLMETSRNFNRLTLKVERSLDRGDYNLRKILEPVLVDVEILAEQMDTVVNKVGDHPGDLFFKSRTVKYGPGEKQ
jgi:phospholipid/cholesterol/gamma-HCH transport system substrate-binding protein